MIRSLLLNRFTSTRVHTQVGAEGGKLPVFTSKHSLPGDSAGVGSSDPSRAFLPADTDAGRIPVTERDGLAELIARLHASEARSADTLRAEARELWLKGDFRAETLHSFYASVLDRLPEDSLLRPVVTRLVDDLRIPKSLSRYHENLSGRYFDSAFADELVRNPPAAVLVSAEETGKSLSAVLHESKNRNIVLLHLRELVQSDRRPWFANCPDITEFLANPDMKRARKMFTTVRHGYDAIKLPYLSVRTGWALQQAHETPTWLRKANAYFGLVVGPERTTSIPPDAIRRLTQRAGILLHYQAQGTFRQPNFMLAKSWSDDKLPSFERASNFEKQAMLRGHAVVNGASGSANILGFLHRNLAMRNPRHSVEDALLNTVMFLVYDGGHSVHEVAAVDAMIMASERMQHAGERRLDPRRLRAILSDYQLDYRTFLERSSTDPAVLKSMLQRALDRTIAA